MGNDLLVVATVLAALGSGLIGGFFYAFSNTVMRALSRVAPPCGIAAMQTINFVVINPLFMAAFLGTAVLGTALAIAALVVGVPGRAWLLAGAVLYVVGSLVVTMVCNVPRNNILAPLDASAAASVPRWTEYVASWTRWNHVRTAASLAASVAFTLALAS
jgi:uncharacterized membrane protein